METNQINYALQHFPSFIGTFACDQLPLIRINKRPFSLVINTDKKTESGEHWTAIHVPARGEPEYFDSFGFPPLIKTVQDFLGTNSDVFWTYSANSIQHPFSMSCGQFCTTFIKYRISGKSYQSFISIFSQDTSKNDIILRKMNKRFF